MNREEVERKKILKGRCWRTKKTEKIPVIKMLKTIPPIFFPSLRCKRKAYRHCLSSKVLIKYDACVEEAHKKKSSLCYRHECIFKKWGIRFFPPGPSPIFPPFPIKIFIADVVFEIKNCAA